MIILWFRVDHWQLKSYWIIWCHMKPKNSVYSFLPIASLAIAKNSKSQIRTLKIRHAPSILVLEVIVRKRVKNWKNQFRMVNWPVWIVLISWFSAVFRAITTKTRVSERCVFYSCLYTSRQVYYHNGCKI